MATKDLTDKTPDPIDVHVGKRLRLRRNILKMSQEKLGEATGVTFQQVQKYEKGSNRISASRLFDFAKVLGVNISYFFEDLGDDMLTTREKELDKKLTSPLGMAEEATEGMMLDPMERTESLDLVRAYWKIGNDTQRKALLDMARSMAGVRKGEEEEA